MYLSFGEKYSNTQWTATTFNQELILMCTVLGVLLLFMCCCICTICGGPDDDYQKIIGRSIPYREYSYPSFKESKEENPLMIDL